MDRVPACLDHTVVAMALDGVGPEAVMLKGRHPS